MRKGGDILGQRREWKIIGQSPVLAGRERLNRLREIEQGLYKIFSRYVGKEAEKPPEK
ncbi:hypothetical protein [Intestinimonas massiliensis (ex Afouda et al. 2020)]|uniref:hypothetical protein n=1 Tax=Intestinimonas massiliensis (ex Afouda et al. 2020) TaxID=1673721 RepID=UPI0013EF0846|nr:hypothetical protein [Intestinimonas massiliensis (ex Afouda et al. 2020)]